MLGVTWRYALFAFPKKPVWISSVGILRHRPALNRTPSVLVPPAVVTVISMFIPHLVCDWSSQTDFGFTAPQYQVAVTVHLLEL